MSAIWESVRQGLPLTTLDIVDMHAHIGRCAVPNPDVSLAAHIKVMDRVGVNSAVISSTQCMSWNMGEGNRQVLRAMRAFPGRFLGYVTLFPTCAQAVQAETEQCIRQGFAGIKLHNSNGFRYTDPCYLPAFQIADERRLPVLLHSWGDAPTIEDVRTLASRFTETAFLLAHAGVVAESVYIAVAREYPNVYLDPTMSRTPRGLWERLVAAVGPEKIVWGSDAVFLGLPAHIGKVGGAAIDETAKRLILGGNARRLLGRGAFWTDA